MSSRRVAISTSMLLLISGAAAGCDSGEDTEDGHFYCANSAGTVVDEDLCDENSSDYDSGMFFFYMGSSVHGGHSYPVGTRLPPKAQKFSVTDRTARSKFGLPKTGRVGNGTVKTGVIGKGGPASSVKGGGVSGGKSGGG